MARKEWIEARLKLGDKVRVTYRAVNGQKRKRRAGPRRLSKIQDNKPTGRDVRIRERNCIGNRRGGWIWYQLE
jgi:hypothetical protein